MSVGEGTAVGSGVTVGTRVGTGMGAGIGVGGPAAIIAATPDSIVALTSGGAVGVAVSSAFGTAVSAALTVLGVGGGHFHRVDEHPTSATSSAIAATNTIFIRPPYPHPLHWSTLPLILLISLTTTHPIAGCPPHPPIGQFLIRPSRLRSPSVHWTPLSISRRVFLTSVSPPRW